MVRFGIRYTTGAGALFCGADLIQRMGDPVIQTWSRTASLSESKQKLGDNFGAALFEYALIGASGGLGSRYSERTLPAFKAFTKVESLRPCLASPSGLSPEATCFPSISRGDVSKLPTADLVMYNTSKSIDLSDVHLSGITKLVSSHPERLAAEARGNVFVYPTVRNYLSAHVSNGSANLYLNVLDVLRAAKYNGFTFFDSMLQRDGKFRLIQESFWKMRDEPLCWHEDQYRLKFPVVQNMRLSGVVDVSSRDWLPIRPGVGDVHVLEVLKKRTSLGQSGYLLIRTWNGYQWKGLDVVPTSFQSKRQCDELLKRLREIVVRKKGAYLSWEEGANRFLYRFE